MLYGSKIVEYSSFFVEFHTVTHHNVLCMKLKCSHLLVSDVLRHAPYFLIEVYLYCLFGVLSGLVLVWARYVYYAVKVILCILQMVFHQLMHCVLKK